MNDVIQLDIETVKNFKIPAPKPIEVGKTYEIYMEAYSYHYSQGGTLMDYNIGIDYHITVEEFLEMLLVDRPSPKRLSGYESVHTEIRERGNFPNSFTVVGERVITTKLVEDVVVRGNEEERKFLVRLHW